MQKLPGSGKAKNIGICNFQLVNLDKLLSDPTCKVIPAVNQIEVSIHIDIQRIPADTA